MDGAGETKVVLRLDCTKLKRTLGRRPRRNIDRAVEMICRFSRVRCGGDLSAEMDAEITACLNEDRTNA